MSENESSMTRASSAREAEAPPESAAPAASSGNPPPQKPAAFAPPPAIPTQEAVDGIRYDFNCGCRVFIPKNAPRLAYHVVIRDLENDVVLCATTIQTAIDGNPEAKGRFLASAAKYYTPFGIEVYDPADLRTPIWRHEMSLEGRPVVVQMPMGALGDTVGWMSYVEAFQRKFRPSSLTLSMRPVHAALFAAQYPEISFTDMAGAAEAVKGAYATYHVGLFFKGDSDWQPYDFREVGLHRTAAYILGVPEAPEIPPRVRIGERTIGERYVCIGVQASAAEKMWLNPHGWREVVKFLKERGYRVLCIDREPVTGAGFFYNHIPNGAEDFTGDRTLQERVDMLAHADFFVGLGSGLSWLAWAAGTPVVMISGFSNPGTEFRTPYRVQNTRVCHGCWDDQRVDFDHGNFFWCPRKQGKPSEMFECTKCITPKMVIDAIRRIPAFREMEAKAEAK